MMWHALPQNVGVEESCAIATTSTMPNPIASRSVKVAIRIRRGAMRPPLTRASQRRKAESGSEPGRSVTRVPSRERGTSGAPRAPSLEAAQHQDREQEVEPEQDQDVAPHPAVPEL